MCLMAVAISSCKKEETIVKSNNLVYKTAFFSGTQSKNLILTVNGSRTFDGPYIILNKSIQVKKGDVLKYVDTGEDIIITPEEPIYQCCPFVIVGYNPAVIQQGFVYGSIVVDNQIVKTSQGQDDVNLTYTVQ